jgi:hypothetical protein
VLAVPTLEGGSPAEEEPVSTADVERLQEQWRANGRLLPELHVRSAGENVEIVHLHPDEALLIVAALQALPALLEAEENRDRLRHALDAAKRTIVDLSGDAELKRLRECDRILTELRRMVTDDPNNLAKAAMLELCIEKAERRVERATEAPKT